MSKPLAQRVARLEGLVIKAAILLTQLRSVHGEKFSTSQHIRILELSKAGRQIERNAQQTKELK